ncbi:MAG TPA: pyridoxal phosphate-dependent aminotransferase [Syntrophomonadaceae bacterium]|nr:pyridoxal phosphate-dependent aminotransferase [Syntrophomonadaceae bacterium]
MQEYDFDTIIERRHTGSAKWDGVHCTRENGRIPMWVADMDFLCPPEITRALMKRAEHGIYGYAICDESYYEVIVNWMQKRHGWKIEKDWICTSPGIVTALDMLLRTYTEPGDKVVIQPPVYYPFFSVVANNKCELLENPLLLDEGKYRIDFEDLEEKFKSGTKIFLFCSPHNPVGRVWTREELVRLGALCLEYDVLVIADEIHSDLIFPGLTHHVFADLSEDLARQTIVCNAPSKTFNLAGLQASNIIISNPDLRKRYNRTMRNSGLGLLNVFAIEGLKAAYTFGEPWLDELLVYLKANYDFLQTFIEEKTPQLILTEAEGTYLAWIDFRNLILDDAAVEQQLKNEADLILERGSLFGTGGQGFQRLNFACPRVLLSAGLNRLAYWINTQ